MRRAGGLRARIAEICDDIENLEAEREELQLELEEVELEIAAGGEARSVLVDRAAHALRLSGAEIEGLASGSRERVRAILQNHCADLKRRAGKLNRDGRDGLNGSARVTL